jgi:uncharacterized membrane protein YhaH (DUF805 family)
MGQFPRLKHFILHRKRDFFIRRGRMPRSRFFLNMFTAALSALLYVLALRQIVLFMADLHLPRLLYSNTYNVGVGILFLLLGLGTRIPRLKRLRDAGLPVLLDWPFFLLLLGCGLSPISHALHIPYLQHVLVIYMPENVRDILAPICLFWMLFILLAPSHGQTNPFASQVKQPQNKSLDG